ncbi:DUF6197 family protein (plasmid) [Streptomyces globisporus]|uniref:DUF6197 family protein n=1 Tax=Streptomyces globisporus TaxID=1908 RepID=UPI002F9070EE|nr:DUF6197 family protein [Streptomyces globisporus]
MHPYSPESVVIADEPVWMLRWAACHLEHVGLHQGSGLFNGPGRTVTLACWPRGAIEVAAGRGRGKAGRAYDWDRIHAARDQAMLAFAEHLTGRPLDPTARDVGGQARAAIDQWSAEAHRTAATAAQALRAAADALSARPAIPQV